MNAQGLELPPWHAALFDRLQAQLRGERPAHAYLLQGRPGLGKGMLARYLAHSMLCQAPRAGHPCLDCSSCHLLAAGTHPDLRLVEPEERRNIVVDQVRGTVEFMSKTAQQGGRKLILIEPAEAMNNNAANALLKVLEEPAAGTLLLLVSHQGALLPATIRSRCQTLRFSPPERAVAAAWLEAKTVSGVDGLLALADGAPLRALALADEDARHERSVLHDTLLRLFRGEIAAVEAAADCATFGLAGNIEGMMLCLADLLRYSQGGGRTALKDREVEALALALLEIVQGDAMSAGAGERRDGQLARGLHRLHDKLLEARRALVGNSNPNPQLMLEWLFFAWAGLPLMRTGS